MKPTQSGITLIEGMVTIAIVAILAAIAGPSFQNAFNSSRLRSAAEAVYGEIQFAKSESVKQDRNLFVTIQGSGTTNWCIGISNTTNCNCNTPGNCMLGPTGSQTERVIKSNDFSSITLTANPLEIEFNSRRGSTVSGGNTIALTGASNLNTTIETSTLGRVRICGGNLGGYSSC